MDWIAWVIGTVIVVTIIGGAIDSIGAAPWEGNGDD